MNRFIKVYYHTNDENINNIRKIYKEYIYQFHKRYTKMKIFIDDRYKKLVIKLVGFDKEVKKIYKRFKPNIIFRDIDSMPMSNVTQKPKSLSLYADYNPQTTIKGLGFKDKKKALDTIKKIKSMDYSYQINLINTMINRAKYHPHINKDMKDAIKIYNEYKKILKEKRERVIKRLKPKGSKINK